jgi:hypothetical protein
MRNTKTRKCVALAILLLAFAVVVDAALAQESGLPRSWKGRYAYAKEDRPAVPFSLEVTSVQGTSFLGRITEPASFGKDPCSTLYANVEGDLDGQTVTFTKTYDGTCGEKHSVSYSGKVDKTFTAMWGTWMVTEDWGGVFTAHPASPKSQDSN